MPANRLEKYRAKRSADQSPEPFGGEGADLVCRAIERRPKRVAMPLGLLSEAAYLLAPGAMDAYNNVLYRLFPGGVDRRDLERWVGGAISYNFV